MSEHDKEPAFPQASDHSYAYKGMTLRDWFAGQALANAFTDYGASESSQIAEWAYILADAMLKERAKGVKDYE